MSVLKVKIEGEGRRKIFDTCRFVRGDLAPKLKITIDGQREKKYVSEETKIQ